MLVEVLVGDTGYQCVHAGDGSVCSFVIVCFFFFFQAEDGIRDLTVTGVQTCALPILRERERERMRERRERMKERGEERMRNGEGGKERMVWRGREREIEEEEE